MKLRRYFLSTFLLALCSAVQADILDHLKLEIAGPIKVQPKLDVLDFKDAFTPIDIPSSAYEAECGGKSSTYYGTLHIDHTQQIDPTRCIRHIKQVNKTGGHFDLVAEHEDFHQLGRPYLISVEGHVIIDGDENLDEIYFPRLNHIGGNVTLDLNDVLEYVDMPKITHLNTLTVEFRPMNTDLSGLNNVTFIDWLVLNNDAQGNDFVVDIMLSGLNGVTKVRQLNINGESVYDDGSNVQNDVFLTALVEVEEDLKVDGKEMIQLYGLQNLQKVGQDLTISDSSELRNLNGLGSLSEVGGVLHLKDIVGMTSTDGIGGALVGGLIVEENPDLTDISALNNLSFSANGSAYFSENPELPCSQIDDFENSHPGLSVGRGVDACSN